MALGLIGRKRGMTRVFTEDGDSVPVTVIEVEPNRVPVKTPRPTATAPCRSRRRQASQPHHQARSRHFAKASRRSGRGLWEFRLGENEGADLATGTELKVDLFEAGQLVDVQGTPSARASPARSSGTTSRWADATHGNSVSHRAPGSIGQRQTPGRVFKGKKMSGHLGNVKRAPPRTCRWCGSTPSATCC
jgi:large subunit ribosomal protein L3